MLSVRTFGRAAVVVAVIGVGFALANRPVRAYRDTPATINNPSSDITDTYIFPSPSNPNNVVIVMDVYPLIPSGSGRKTFFSQSVLYTMKFDNRIGEEGHVPAENIVIQFSVGAPSGGTQQIFVYGPQHPNEVGSTTTVGTQTGVGAINQSFSADSGQLTVFAGAREDPAFYDRAQLMKIIPNRNQGSGAPSCLPGGTNACPHGFNNPGTDTQATTNVLSFVVEMPKSLLQNASGNMRVAYWATTSSETGN